MDEDTKHLLKSICAVLHDVTEQAFHAHEMAEKMHDACATAVPEFRMAYDSSRVLNDGHTVRSKQQILDALSKVTRQLGQ